MFDNFERKYPQNKTLAFELIPVEKTKEYIEQNGLLDEDNKRDSEYKIMKGIIDEFHKTIIDEVLEKVSLKNINEFTTLYDKVNKTNDELKKFDKVKENLRKELQEPLYKKAIENNVFKKELIKEKLKELFAQSQEESKIIKNFENFTTYFTGFNENRKNLYSSEEKSTAIAYRIIHENLPRFYDNIKSFNKIKENKNVMDKIESGSNLLSIILEGKSLNEVFEINNFNNTLRQKDIDRYNQIIGGYTKEDGTKVKGLNEYINLYNQTVPKSERLPKLKPLLKQILSDRSTESFRIEILETDEDLKNALIVYQEGTIEKILGEYNIKNLINSLAECDLSKIYVKAKYITDISTKLFGDWSILKQATESEYDLDNLSGKITIKYEREKATYFKNKKYFSIEELDRALIRFEHEVYSDGSYQISKYFTNKFEVEEIDAKITNAYNTLKNLFLESNGKKFRKDKKIKDAIKSYLDILKELQGIVNIIITEDISDKDEVFYGSLEYISLELENLNRLYDKVRNYLTKKPYSTEKIKLNFSNPALLSGWTNPSANSGIIFYDGKYYYLGVINRGYNKDFKNGFNKPIDDKDKIEELIYLQADPAKEVQNLLRIDGIVQKKNGRKDENGENTKLEFLKNEYLPEDINQIRKNKSYSKLSEKFKKEDLIRFIDYYKSLLLDYKAYEKFDFNFRETSEYENFKEFTDHLSSKSYQLKFEAISKLQLDALVDEGKIYLFKIYNKDFSPHSKGTKNLHTLYWKMLFDSSNLEENIYKLNGNAEIFFRKGSIKESEIIRHPANQAIDNKNPLNEKKTSLFDYDLIKDKRYTVDKFKLHVPITLNYTSENVKNINKDVNEVVLENEDIKILGIDRGERNLLYLTLIDSKGSILLQKSLNIISNKYMNNENKEMEYKIDYHGLLEEKAEGRLSARKNWDTIENIKEIKEGYLSQCINEIVSIVKEHKCIIVLEDLNIGFKRGRQKMEVQIYQKFEKMLISKLNYVVDKKVDKHDEFGLLHAKQLANPFESFQKLGKQSGILYYVPAWGTSKIDPTTGFMNLEHFKYKNLDDAKKIISKFDRISYNKEEGYFEFDIDYSKFNQRYPNSRKKWTVCSHGDRILRKRNKLTKGFETEKVQVTELFIELFEKYNIEWQTSDIKKQAIEVKEVNFFKSFISIYNLIVQMRNSDKEEDYIISPVKGENDIFYDSRVEDEKLPRDADANGAYNIARKGILAIEKIKNANDIGKVKLAATNEEWLIFAQNNNIE